MEGKARGAGVFDRAEGRRPRFSLISEETRQRLKRLTWKKLIIRLGEFVFKRASLLVIHKNLDSPPTILKPALEVECYRLDPGHAGQIAGLNNLARESIDLFWTDGSKCLGVFYQGRLIAYLWCHYKDHRFPFFAYSLEVGDGVYLGPDFVLPEFRGNRIHGFLLTRIFALLFEEGCRSVWSAVLSDNYPSLKGALQVGFTLKKQIKVIRVFKAIVCKAVK